MENMVGADTTPYPAPYWDPLRSGLKFFKINEIEGLALTSLGGYDLQAPAVCC